MVEDVIRQLDELSVRMVVGGADAPDTLQLLAAIEKTAREAGRAPAADAAMELKARATGAAKTSLEEFERVITSGIENLRRALEPRPAAAAAPNAIAQALELNGGIRHTAGGHP